VTGARCSDGEGLGSMPAAWQASARCGDGDGGTVHGQRWAVRCPDDEVQRVMGRGGGWRHMGRGGSTPGDWGVAHGEGLGGVGTGHWRGD
jgi:hypothetical protein